MSNTVICVLPPKQRTIIRPRGGWKPHTLYLVQVSFNSKNPIHESYLFVGFLDRKGNPSGYTKVWNSGYETEVQGLEEIHYLKPVKKLHSEH